MSLEASKSITIAEEITGYVPGYFINETERLRQVFGLTYEDMIQRYWAIGTYLSILKIRNQSMLATYRDQAKVVRLLNFESFGNTDIEPQFKTYPYSYISIPDAIGVIAPKYANEFIQPALGRIRHSSIDQPHLFAEFLRIGLQIALVEEAPEARLVVGKENQYVDYHPFSTNTLLD